MGFLGTRAKQQPETLKSISDVVSRFNHAFATGDCAPLLEVCDDLGEYSCNFFGDAGVIVGSEAPTTAREDFGTFQNAGQRFDVVYQDGMDDGQRGFWIVRLIDQATGEDFLASLSLSLNPDKQVSRFFLIADNAIR
ncbi:MAG: hypothetical protein AAFQ22_12835 [Pseudomonadota bacterium]